MASPRYQVQAQGRTYTVIDDLRVSQTAIITGALVDEVSGLPLQAAALITTDLPGLYVNVTPEGLFAVSAYTELVFPKLATTSYIVNLNITAPGYRAANVAVTIPIAATFPIVRPPIKMRPLPVRVQGRVVKESDHAPITPAAIASGNPNVLLLRSTLRFDHASGVTINSLSVVPPVRSLTADASQGSNSIFLNDVTGLAAAQLLQIGVDGSAEIAVIALMGPGPKQITLQAGLRSTFSSGAFVQQLTAGAAVNLTRSSNAGDGLLLVSAAVAGSAAQIVDGAQTESCVLNAVSDAAGYYHLNGMTGFVSLKLQCSATGFTTANKTWSLFYNDPVNVVDFRLKP